MSFLKFSDQDIKVLHQEDFLVEDDGTRAIFSGNQRLFLREIKKKRLGSYQIHLLRKNPSGELSLVDKICNEFTHDFFSLKNAIHYLKKQEKDV